MLSIDVTFLCRLKIKYNLIKKTPTNAGGIVFILLLLVCLFCASYFLKDAGGWRPAFFLVVGIKKRIYTSICN